MQRRIKPILVTVACVACAAVGYQLRVLADGAPAGPALFYSGTLERDGALASGSYEIALSLYSAAEGGEQLCKVEAVTDGRQRALPHRGDRLRVRVTRQRQCVGRSRLHRRRR